MTGSSQSQKMNEVQRDVAEVAGVCLEVLQRCRVNQNSGAV